MDENTPRHARQIDIPTQKVQSFSTLRNFSGKFAGTPS